MAFARVVASLTSLVIALYNAATLPTNVNVSTIQSGAANATQPAGNGEPFLFEYTLRRTGVPWYKPKFNLPKTVKVQLDWHTPGRRGRQDPVGDLLSIDGLTNDPLPIPLYFEEYSDRGITMRSQVFTPEERIKLPDGSNLDLRKVVFCLNRVPNWGAYVRLDLGPKENSIQYVYEKNFSLSSNGNATGGVEDPPHDCTIIPPSERRSLQ